MNSTPKNTTINFFFHKKKIPSDIPKWSFSDFETEPKAPFGNRKFNLFGRSADSDCNYTDLSEMWAKSVRPVVRKRDHRFQKRDFSRKPTLTINPRCQGRIKHLPQSLHTDFYYPEFTKAIGVIQDLHKNLGKFLLLLGWLVLSFSVLEEHMRSVVSRRSQILKRNFDVKWEKTIVQIQDRSRN